MNKTISTPWGASQGCEEIAEGITFYSTAGHGGIKLDRKHNAGMPDYMRIAGGWYEEDCDWALVAIVYPDGFTAPQREQAETTLRNWHPESWERWHGRKLQEGESYTRDEQIFNERHAADWIVTSACGAWHDDCPDGFVLVTARVGGYLGDPQGKTCRDFLVPDDEYRERGRYGFIVDPARHSEQARKAAA